MTRWSKLTPQQRERLEGPVKRLHHARVILDLLDTVEGHDAQALSLMLRQRGIEADRADVYNSVRLLESLSIAERAEPPRNDSRPGRPQALWKLGRIGYNA